MTKILDAHVAHWALKKSEPPRLGAEIAANPVRVKRKTVRRRSLEKVKRADPVVIGTAVLGLFAIEAPPLVAGIVGGAILIGASTEVHYELLMEARP